LTARSLLHWRRDGLRVEARGAAIVFLVLGVLAIVLFDAVWARVGLVAALILVFGAILAFAWNVDRKDKAKRAGLDELPDV
jgi:Flp pilus assembly protein TadB